jgi:hypothetical protein
VVRRRRGIGAEREPRAGVDELGPRESALDARVAEAARSAGYALGFTAYATAVEPSTDPLMIGRIEIQNASMQEFARTISATLADGG